MAPSVDFPRMPLELMNSHRTEVETIRTGTSVTKAGSEGEILLQNKTKRLDSVSLSSVGSLWGLCGVCCDPLSELAGSLSGGLSRSN